MEDKKDLESPQTEIPQEEVLLTECGYEATMMKDPVNGTPLFIRECFDRWQLIDDNETDREYEMRKRLLNAFKKKSKERGRVIHKSTELSVEEINGKPSFVSKGSTYVKPKE